MPQTVNLSGGGAQIGAIFVRSITASLFASVIDQSVEVPYNVAKYCIGHMFSANNAGGTDFGQFSVDFSDLMITATGKANIQDVIVAQLA